MDDYEGRLRKLEESYEGRLKALENKCRNNEEEFRQYREVVADRLGKHLTEFNNLKKMMDRYVMRVVQLESKGGSRESPKVEGTPRLIMPPDGGHIDLSGG